MKQQRHIRVITVHQGHEPDSIRDAIVLAAAAGGEGINPRHRLRAVFVERQFGDSDIRIAPCALEKHVMEHFGVTDERLPLAPREFRAVSTSGIVEHFAVADPPG
jgi:hypothetical protein